MVFGIVFIASAIITGLVKLFGYGWLTAALAGSVLSAVSLDSTVIPILIAVLSSGFVFGLFKVLPERKSILVQASENAVKVVNDAIGTLQKELIDARTEIVRLEIELKSAKASRILLETELGALQQKVMKLETQLNIYQDMQIRDEHERRQNNAERERRLDEREEERSRRDDERAKHNQPESD